MGPRASTARSSGSRRGVLPVQELRVGFALQVTARLNGAVVAQAVHTRGPRPLLIGLDDGCAIPSPDGGPVATVHWLRLDRLRVCSPLVAEAEQELGPGQLWTWAPGDGLVVELGLVQRSTFRLPSALPTADLSLLALVLTIFVFLGHTRLLFEEMAGQQPEVAAPEPSPELIARLLERATEGADEGLEERVDRAEIELENDSFYLPSGSDGPMSHAEGGAKVGEEAQRVEAADEELSEDATEPPAPVVELVRRPPPPELPELPELAITEVEAPTLLGAPDEEEPLPPVETTDEGMPEPVERFVGWGFKDWLRVKEARPKDHRAWSRELDMARARMRIDPDDPWSLNTVGLYAYLSEKHDLAEATYERFLQLYPEEPAAYNNYALVWKRRGDYVKEEALYRRALQLEPGETNAMNNLAVCLAHQGRFAEAVELMDQLEKLEPDNAYVALHQAKIYAAMGKERKALRFLERALDQSRGLDTMHHIEFRQDIRLDPAFDVLRGERRFRELLERAYGSEAAYLITGSRRARPRRDRRGELEEVDDG